MRCPECGQKECCGASLGPELDELRRHAESLAKALDNIEVMVEDEETEIRWTAKNALDVYFAAYPREGT